MSGTQLNTEIVLVTDKEYRKAPHVFEQARADGWDCRPVSADEATLADRIRETGAKYVVVGVERYAEALYQAVPKGGVIARFGVGHDGIDKPQASKYGIYCTNTPGALDQAVAEHTLALMLSAARQIPQTAAACVAGKWQPVVGFELKGKKLAIIGCGPIGCAVARMATYGFGMQVTACVLRETDAEQLRAKYGIHRITQDWNEAVQDAQFVSLHLPSIPATHHFVQTDRLSAMAPYAWLINTARGAIVDESALFDAITQGVIAGAALDVFEEEPYSARKKEKALNRLQNVLMTPHCASSTVEACAQMAYRCLSNLEAAREGTPASMDLLNQEMLYI